MYHSLQPIKLVAIRGIFHHLRERFNIQLIIIVCFNIQQTSVLRSNIIELVKLLVANSLLENDPDEEFDELRFAVEDGTNLLVLINKGEVTGAVNIENTYEFASSHYNDFKNLRDDEDIVINQEWILNKLSENENE